MHQVNDGVLGATIKFRGIGFFKVKNVTGKVNAHHLHS